MDAELVTLASTAGTALVTALATDAWTTARSAAVTLWRRVYPDRADVVDGELAEARAELVEARRVGDRAVEEGLVGEWQGRLRRLLAADPGAAAELRRILDEEWRAAVPGQSWTGTVEMRARASGNARVYQVGQGDQHIVER